MLTRRYQLLLLAAVILAVYHPAVSADFSVVDDVDLTTNYASASEWDLRGLFFPYVTTGLYYRPLTGLSFLVDRIVFSLDPGLMHLENILLHLLNVILVYVITREMMPHDQQKGSLVPLTAALVFGLHPINAESVNWVSGRTDILAGVFVLLSAFFLMRFRDIRQGKYLALALLFFIGGVLCKETTFAFLLGGFFLVSAKQSIHERDGTTEDLSKRTTLALTALCMLGAVLVIMAVSMMKASASMSPLSKTLRAMNEDWIYSMLVVLRAFAFYLKKLIMPYPLNLAILEIDPLYQVMAVPLAALCIFIAGRGTLLSALFTTGVLLITPAFVLAFGQIAWTPYAERYLYISSAFVSIAAVVYLQARVRYPWALVAKVLVVAVVAIMFVATLNRSLVWRDDLALAKDTVEKSPYSKDMRAVYGGLLAKKGDYAGALQQLERGRALPFFAYDERYDLYTADIYEKLGRIDEAIELNERALQRTNYTSTKALNNVLGSLKEKVNVSRTEAEKTALYAKILTYSRKLFELNRDPHLLLDMGAASAALGKKKEAIAYYQRARDMLADAGYLKLLAQNRIASLSRASGTHADNR